MKYRLEKVIRFRMKGRNKGNRIELDGLSLEQIAKGEHMFDSYKYKSLKPYKRGENRYGVSKRSSTCN